MAYAARVVGLPRGPDMTKDGQLSRYGPQATAFAGLGIAPSQSAGLNHNHFGNGLAAFAAANLLALGFSCVPELAAQRSLFELSDGTEDLTHQLGSRRRVRKVGRCVYRHQ